ncbi:MAG: hypothetical protein ACI9N0_000960 [Ilumatobacter sp.]
MVTDLRVFLDGAVYSGMPWGNVQNYPTAGLNPVDIVPRAIEAVQPHVHETARGLWGYHAPKPPKPPKVDEPPKTSDEPDV